MTKPQNKPYPFKGTDSGVWAINQIPLQTGRVGSTIVFQGTYGF
ncbi:hypothetical protein [Arenibacter algicola]|nr:hypothetical protein [Arenibacter algicola]